MKKGSLPTYESGRKLFARFITLTVCASNPPGPRSGITRTAQRIANTPGLLRRLLEYPTILPHFIAFARGLGRRASTISTYVHGIRFFAHAPCYSPPPLPHNVVLLLRGCRNLEARAKAKGVVSLSPTFATLSAVGQETDAPTPTPAPTPTWRRGKAPPVLGPMVTNCLEALHARVSRAPEGTFDTILLAAMLAVGFNGCLRISEYLALGDTDKWLRVCDVTWAGVPPAVQADTPSLVAWLGTHSTAAMQLGIRADKTSRPGDVRIVRIPTSPAEQWWQCPVRLLAHYLSLRATRLPCVSTDPLFVLASGRPPNLHWFNTALKHVLGQCGVPDAKRYSSHSLRRGMASTLASLGAPAEEVKAMGRWASTAYKGYIVESSQQALAAQAHARLAAVKARRR